LFGQREETEDQRSPTAEVVDEEPSESPAMSTDEVAEQRNSDDEDHPEQTQSQQSLREDEDEQSEASPSGSRHSTLSQASVQDRGSDQEVCMEWE